MNINLVKGERTVRDSEKFVDYGDIVNKSLAPAIADLEQKSLQAEQQKKAANQRTARYIDQLRSDIDLTELSEEQQAGVTKFLVKGRNEYANAASALANIDDFSSAAYAENKAKMESVNRSFRNLSGQVKTYKEDKIAFLKDFDQDMISVGNSPEDLDRASKMFTDGSQLGVGKNGQLVFWDDENADYVNYGEMPDPFLKDYKSADALLKMNESIYKAGTSLNGAMETMTRQKINTMIAQGGRDTLLSLASDDFLLEGGLGLQDPSLFEIGNDDALRSAVVEGYMSVLKDTASQGARNKRPSSNISTSGFSGALKDEISVTGNVAQDAIDFANMAGEDTKSIVKNLNNINPNKRGDFLSREEAYSMYLDSINKDKNAETQKEFSDTYGDDELYTFDNGDIYGVPIDMNNQKALYQLYLQSVDGLSNKGRNYWINKFPGQNGNKEVNVSMSESEIKAQELIEKYGKQ
tara:strand:- start:124 stop:1521 length:1398 start_codon:yes stop_codon:yes gene_type:complete